jgi:hypothetical protein
LVYPECRIYRIHGCDLLPTAQGTVELSIAPVVFPHAGYIGVVFNGVHHLLMPDLPNAKT